ncbi:extracellular solute-binding protein [Pseudoxanthobacter sp.]|uniref:extracellular solute-binding protein n=1 Tax=Pseudoxanthobacter sp. TaxID=1925742 RepID=UPI002FE1EDAF
MTDVHTRGAAAAACEPASASGSSVTRRTALAVGLAGLAMPFLARRGLAATPDLRVLTWEGYAEPEWVKPFEEKYGARVSVVYTGSVDEMFAKMQGSRGADFDVVAFDTSSFRRYIDGGLIRPLDMAKIPNAARLSPAFRHVPSIMRDGKTYGVPFAWGSLPLVYNKADFAATPESWEVMWDPANAQRLISLDDANNNITLAAMVLGIKTPFDLSDEQFAAVKAKLIAQKPLLLTYYAGFDEGVSIFAQSNIKAMFSMGEPQVAGLRAKGVDAAFTIPKEGAIGWLDCWTVSAGARDPDLAFAWLNACLDPKVGAFLSDKKSYGNTTDEQANVRNGFTYADKLTFLETPENFEKRVAIWNEVKAA